MQGLLALEDGRIYRGRFFGDPGEAGGEVVFCTAMSGYQEILTDPSYHGQLVAFTSVQIGNYGIHFDHGESSRPWVAGLICRDLCETPSHSEMIEPLRQYARRHGLFGLTDIDTRDLTLHLRNVGVLRGFCTTHVEDPDDAVGRARQIPPMGERDLVLEVTADEAQERARPGASPTPRIAVIDYGVKESILRQLEHNGCFVSVLPAGATSADVDAQRPDGVVLSNGPGDPETQMALLGTVRHIVERYPTLAICLGHQLAGLALGGRIEKLRFGHHGSNHPVRDLRSGRVYVTSQNHNYAIAPDSLPSGTRLTHLNLNDASVEGFMHDRFHLWSYQFHPEGAPGPHDARNVVREFVTSIDHGEVMRAP